MKITEEKPIAIDNKSFFTFLELLNEFQNICIDIGFFAGAEKDERYKEALKGSANAKERLINFYRSDNHHYGK